MLPLEGKTIFITGATSGFGRACTILLAKQGAHIVASGRRIERLHTLTQSLPNTAIHALPLDVRQKEAVHEAISSLPEAFSEIDIVINNAGLALGLASFEHQSMDDLEQMVETNILGVIYCTHALLPGMIERNRGHIVTIGSVAGSYPYPGGNVYGGTKAFVAQFSLNLRADLLGKNIRVTSIEPGMAETEFSLIRLQGDKAKAKSVYEGVTPLSADDIAQSILWCITQPPHVNINRMELMPVQQAFGPFAVDRKN